MADRSDRSGRGGGWKRLGEVFGGSRFRRPADDPAGDDRDGGDAAPTGERSHRARGASFERLAERHLVDREGYRIVARNVTYKFGEIDLVALDGDTLCFVEVKSRTDDRFGPAVLMVDGRKQRRVIRAAEAYLASSHWEGPCRFDVLGIDGAGEGRRFTLLKDAFEVEPD